MISYKYFFTSQRLSSLVEVDIFFLLVILVKNSVVAAFSSCKFSLSCKVFHNFLVNFKMSLGLLEYFDLSSSAYNPDIVSFCRFCLSSTLEKVFEHVSSSSSHLMLA